MIWNENFVWLHIPKTGGTTMSRIFRNIDDSSLNIDDDAKDEKHDSEKDRNLRDQNWKIGERKRVINIRKLSSWLISDWNHKRKHMHLTNLPFEPVKSGLFYSVRLGGIWVTADYWLRYQDVDQKTLILRLEFLECDIREYIFPLTKPRNHTIIFNKRDNKLDLNTEEKARYNLNDRLDVERIYTNNPYWAELENRVY